MSSCSPYISMSTGPILRCSALVGGKFLFWRCKLAVYQAHIARIICSQGPIFNTLQYACPDHLPRSLPSPQESRPQPGSHPPSRSTSRATASPSSPSLRRLKPNLPPRPPPLPLLTTSRRNHLRRRAACSHAFLRARQFSIRESLRRPLDNGCSFMIENELKL
jgi:hypothetical protein